MTVGSTGDIQTGTATGDVYSQLQVFEATNASGTALGYAGYIFITGSAVVA